MYRRGIVWFASTVLVLSLLCMLAPLSLLSSDTDRELFHTLTQSSGEAPVIEWYDSPPHWNSSAIMYVDYIYDGPTQIFWRDRLWVNDSDGVDSVIFRFRWDNRNEWMNQSAVRVDGNESHGQYEGNLTWDVWDIPGKGVVNEADSSKLWFKVFANDSLGYWTETPAMFISYGFFIMSPQPFLLGTSVILLLVVVPVVIVGVLLYWKRGRTNHQELLS